MKTAAKVQNKWYKLQKLKWQPNNTTTTTATTTAQVATATTSRRSSNSMKSQRELGPGSNMNNNLEYCTRYICRYISCTLWQRQWERGVAWLLLPRGLTVNLKKIYLHFACCCCWRTAFAVAVCRLHCLHLVQLLLDLQQQIHYSAENYYNYCNNNNSNENNCYNNNNERRTNCCCGS